MVKETLNFYDVGSKSYFDTNKYSIETRMVKGKSRKFAVASSPSGKYKVWKALSNK